MTIRPEARSTTFPVPGVEAARTHLALKWSVPDGKIGAWIAESDFGTSPAVRAALHRAVDEDFLTYLPERTAREAESACTEFLQRRHGWVVDPADVHLIPDVVEGLRLAIRLLSPPGSAIVVPTPAYAPFLVVPEVLGRRVIEVPSILGPDGRWNLDLDGLDRAFAAGGGMLVLCNPHNPTGQVTTPAEVAAVTETVERHGARVFSDEIHAPLVYRPAAHVPYATTSAAAAAHTVTATATSKGWNIPGLKAAQLILTNDADRRTWARLDPYPAQAGSILGAVAAAAAYRHSDAWLDETLARFDANRGLLGDLLATHLPQLRWRRPEATFLAWLDFGFAGFDVAPAQALDERGSLVVSDGALCGRGFENFVRFNFAMSPEHLEQAVLGMRAAVAAQRPDLDRQE